MIRFRRPRFLSFKDEILSQVHKFYRTKWISFKLKREVLSSPPPYLLLAHIQTSSLSPLFFPSRSLTDTDIPVECDRWKEELIAQSSPLLSSHHFALPPPPFDRDRRVGENEKSAPDSSQWRSDFSCLLRLEKRSLRSLPPSKWKRPDSSLLLSWPRKVTLINGPPLRPLFLRSIGHEHCIFCSGKVLLQSSRSLLMRGCEIQTSLWHSDIIQYLLA